MYVRIAGILLASVLLAGCNLASGQGVVSVTPAGDVVPNVRIDQVATTAFPTQARELNQLPVTAEALLMSDSQTPALADEENVTCDYLGSDARTQHRVVANLDYETKQIQIAHALTYFNTHDTTHKEIILVVEPNVRTGAFQLGDVKVAQQPASILLDLNRLVIPLAQPLLPGCPLDITLQYTINLPPIQSGISGYRGFFGHNVRQINLGLWLATVAPYAGRWLVNEPQAIGEQTVLEQADWELTLNVTNGPENLVVALPGLVEQPSREQWQTRLERARDLPLSISDRYLVGRATAKSGVEIEVYTFADAIVQGSTGTFDGAAHVLRETTRSLEQFEALFGPHPYERLLVIQGDFPDGMEFSGLVFVSTSWFYSFQGGANNYLTLITIHEVAHQWWYAKVGNDAAFAPWLDEALATYSEYIYIEEFYPDLKNWWWSFRVANFYPQGNVDSTVYEFTTIREYINAVYLRGVQMLHNLREDIGTEAFFDLLTRYAQTGSGRIADPVLFWSLLDDTQYSATRRTRDGFLRQPDMIPGRDTE